MAKTCLAVAVILLFAASGAQAQIWDQNWRDSDSYIRVETGWSSSLDAGGNSRGDMGNSGILGLSVGRVFGRASGTDFFGSGIETMRGDVSFFRRSGYTMKGSVPGNASTRFQSDVSAGTIMANFYFSFLGLYAGAGVGVSHNRTASSPALAGELASSFAWQLSSGIELPVIAIGDTDYFSLDLGYRFIDLGEVRAGGGTAHGRLQANEFRTGLRLNF